MTLANITLQTYGMQHCLRCHLQQILPVLLSQHRHCVEDQLHLLQLMSSWERESANQRQTERRQRICYISKGEKKKNVMSNKNNWELHLR